MAWLANPFAYIAINTVIAVMLIGALLLAAWWLGAKRTSTRKGLPYESGVLPSGTARLAWPVPFYLVAIFFIIFDVELAFLFPWAVVFRTLGWFGFLEMFVFIIVVGVGFVYAWKIGALEWE